MAVKVPLLPDWCYDRKHSAFSGRYELNLFVQERFNFSLRKIVFSLNTLAVIADAHACILSAVVAYEIHKLLAS